MTNTRLLQAGLVANVNTMQSKHRLLANISKESSYKIKAKL